MCIEIQGEPFAWSTGRRNNGSVLVASVRHGVMVSIFFDQLVTCSEIPTVQLPAPPFIPPFLHFILGFLYTGTLNFSNRTYDLDTAFHIMRCATYLQLQSLYNEVQARIVQEMMHSLFLAFFGV
jgi:hypothetical protein